MLFCSQNYYLDYSSAPSDIAEFVYPFRPSSMLPNTFLSFPICGLFFFDIRILIAPLVSSNSSWLWMYPMNAILETKLDIYVFIKLNLLCLDKYYFPCWWWLKSDRHNSLCIINERGSNRSISFIITRNVVDCQHGL